MKGILFCLLGMLMMVPAFSQPTVSLNLPKVPDDHIYMETYPADPDAPAVILHDYGELNFGLLSGNLKLYYSYFREIKILSEAGISWAEVRIPFHEDEMVQDIKGFTYSVYTDSGKVVRLKLDRRTIETKRISSTLSEKIIRFPRPMAGSVIMYGYTIVSEDFGRLRPWQFQTSIPVLKSEYVTRIPDPLTYTVVFQGNQRLLTTKKKSFTHNMDLSIRPSSGNFPKIVGGYNQRVFNATLEEVRYSMSSIAGFEREPFMNSPNDYLCRLLFQLSKVRYTHRGTERIMHNWGDLNDRLAIHPNFGKRMDKVKELPLNISSRISALTQGPDQIKAIYETVRDHMQWDGDFSIFARQSLVNVYKKQVGNSADINLLLTKYLTLADYRAYPVLVSTRDHGGIIPVYPVLEQFNHVVVVVEWKNKRIFLDATQPFVPMGMLSLRVANGQGFKIHPKRSGWIPLLAKYTRDRKTYTRFVLDKEGNLDGKIVHFDKEYSAERTRAVLARYDQQGEAYIREQMIPEFEDVEIKAHHILSETTLEDPVVIKCEFQTTDFINDTDDLLLISPLFSEGYEVNPLELNSRNYPVDFSCPIKENYILVLTIPEGYSYQVVPEALHVKLPNGEGEFVYQTRIIGQHLQLLSKIVLNKSRFEPHEYDGIRSFFDHIAAKHDERLVIKKAL